MSEYILELKKISKSFSGVEVQHEVSFALRPGEVHALLGENGAGKSTLVKIITGVHHPDKGEILLDNVPVRFSDTRESRQAGIAAIYQELSLFPNLDVAENIFAGRQPVTLGGRIDWRKLYAEAGKLLDSLGVKLDLKQKARNLSIAQQQMVEIARAFSIHARILIMDEPTSSLTLNEVADLFRLVRRLRVDGTAIIFISHRLEELFEIADRVTVLRDGSYIGTRLMKDVTREDLIRMMVGRTITNLFPKQDVRAGDVALKVENLSRAGSFYDVSFELRRGEILDLARLVGAGRTNVARAIFGVEPATGGRIQVEGRDAAIKSPQQAIELRLDYFDASINRVAAWTIGAHNTLRALLIALLEPQEMLKQFEVEGDFLSRLALLEELKSMPFSAVWDYYCIQKNVRVGMDFMEVIKDYEKKELSKRD